MSLNKKEPSTAESTKKNECAKLAIDKTLTSDAIETLKPMSPPSPSPSSSVSHISR